jgi:hypothetical protein
MRFFRFFQAALGEMEQQQQRLSVIPKRCADGDESGKIKSKDAAGSIQAELPIAALDHIPYFKALQREGFIGDIRAILAV